MCILFVYVQYTIYVKDKRMKNETIEGNFIFK